MWELCFLFLLHFRPFYSSWSCQKPVAASREPTRSFAGNSWPATVAAGPLSASGSFRHHINWPRAPHGKPAR